ncbi:hypothetical protein D3C73_738970 [compost metagenome]
MAVKNTAIIFKEDATMARSKKKNPQKRSAVLREVRENPLFSHRVEKPKKGRGSFKRERGVSRDNQDGCHKAVC